MSSEQKIKPAVHKDYFQQTGERLALGDVVHVADIRVGDGVKLASGLDPVFLAKRAAVDAVSETYGYDNLAFGNTYSHSAGAMGVYVTAVAFFRHQPTDVKLTEANSFSAAF